MIVIAHKLSSIVSADQIIVLREGRIAARGTHGELMESSDDYRRLWTASEESRGWMLKGESDNSDWMLKGGEAT